MELLLAIGALGMTGSLIFIMFNHGKQMESAENASRKTHIREQEKAVIQYIVGSSGLPLDDIPTGESNAMPVCINDGSGAACIGISKMIPTYLKELPVDPKETGGVFTGYRVYLDSSSRTRFCSDYLPEGDEKRCSESTFFTESEANNS